MFASVKPLPLPAYRLRPFFDTWMRFPDQQFLMDKMAESRMKYEKLVETKQKQFNDLFLKYVASQGFGLSDEQQKTIAGWFKTVCELIAINGTAELTWSKSTAAHYGSKSLAKSVDLSGSHHSTLGEIGHSLLPKSGKIKGEVNHGISELGLVVSKDVHYRALMVVDYSTNYFDKEVVDARARVLREFVHSHLYYAPGTKNFTLTDEDAFTDFVSTPGETGKVEKAFGEHAKQGLFSTPELNKAKFSAVSQKEVAPDYDVFAKRIKASFPENKSAQKVGTPDINVQQALGQGFHHSEEWLVEALVFHPEMFVQLLKSKGKAVGTKVYAVVLDIHSTRDVCANCQNALQLLMQQSPMFLGKVADALGKEQYIVSQKSGLRLLVRVSSEYQHPHAHRPTDDNRWLQASVDVKMAHAAQIMVSSVYTA